MVPPTRRSTLGDRAIPNGFGTCVQQPTVVCQERTVADNVPSRAEDCTFSGRRFWQWLGDRDCTAQYNCCLLATTDCQRFCPVCFFVLFNFVQCPCNVFEMIVSPYSVHCYLLTYLLTVVSAPCDCHCVAWGRLTVSRLSGGSCKWLIDSCT